MTDLCNERDSDGKLTDMALACDALSDNGCDCGEDELGTCLACLCEKALMTERAAREKAESRVRALEFSVEAMRAVCAAAVEWRDTNHVFIPDETDHGIARTRLRAAVEAWKERG